MLTASIQAATSILALLALAQGSTQAGGANGPHHLVAAAAASSLLAPATEAISPMTPPPSSSTTFSRHERLEHDLVWRVIKKCCSGCWSGTLRTYRPLTGKNQIALVRPNESPLNFRLRVETTGAVGTWTVWNLARRGDETIVPLRQTPLVRLPQVKVGFHEGIILRIPRDMKRILDGGGPQQPPLGFEIGFWDASMRRTTVVEYQRQKRRQPWMTRRRQRPWHLHDIIVIQQRREHERRSEPTFVGNITDPEALLVLPEAAPFRLEDCNIDSFHLHQVESVNLQTMERQKRKFVIISGSRGSDDGERRLLEERIARAFTTKKTTGRSNSTAGRRIFRSVLPNQMLVALPTSFSLETIGRDIDNNRSRTSHAGPPLRAMFALWPPEKHDDDRRGGRDHLWVVEVTYDTATGQGLAVTLYSLRETPK
jgi:hypothetical protein